MTKKLILNFSFGLFEIRHLLHRIVEKNINQSKLHMPKFILKSSSGNILYGNTVTLDTSFINNAANYGGMLYELKKLNIRDGFGFQIDNAGDILMEHAVYEKCARLLKKFGVKRVN